LLIFSGGYKRLDFKQIGTHRRDNNTMKINTILKFALFSFAGSSFVTATSTAWSATALDEAVREGNLEVVRQLVNSLPPGADINAKGEDGIFSNCIQNEIYFLSNRMDSSSFCS